MDLEAFIGNQPGINIIVRNQMRGAFHYEESTHTRLAALITLTSDYLIQPAIRNQLRMFWSQNFNGYIEDVANAAPDETLGWILAFNETGS